jgi:hypothetical protein
MLEATIEVPFESEFDTLAGAFDAGGYACRYSELKVHARR